MAISYDDWKKQYEGLTTEQQKNYANMVKGNATAEAYAKQYIQEKQNAGTFGQQTANSYTNANQSTNTSSSNNYSSNSNNQNGTNGGNNTINSTPRTQEEINKSISDAQNRMRNGERDMTMEEYRNQQNQGGSPLSDGKNGNGGTYGKFTFDADEYLDESKFGKSNGEITVKEGTAAQTGRPDYEIETKERLTEMVNNLNTYWDSNPEFFNDRETFNRVFEYNTRQSQAQRDLLDSYWKKAQDYKKASSYNNSASFTSDLDSGNVSESEFEALKKYNQDVYIQWQKEMQDKLNAAIANLANPFSIDDMTTALNKIVEKFNLQAGDPYDIIGGWNQMMEKTGAWDSMKQAQQHFTAADDAIAQIKRIQSNYSSSTGGNQSDALIAARLQKALLPYETLLSNELSAGQHWQSLYNTQLGTANNYANTIQMQAQEDQRIFNQKIAALGFAMKVYDYRTPEQQAQLKLQTQQISNNMALLQQSQLNDLSLYNQYATTRLQNQLNYEMQDLTVTDPKQLRANLSNVLDQWYEQYGDIIQRPKSQVIEDVIAYAKANNMSVGEALRKNFIEPLMSKPEYQQSIKDAYGMNSKTTFQKIGDTLVGLTVNPDGTYQVKNLGYYGDATSGVSGVGVGATSSSSVAGNQWSNGNQTKLGEDVVDTGIANVYGSTVKLAPTVGAMLQNAIDSLKAQGIDLKIGDSYRSYETQKAAYEKDQALPADQRKGVAAPGKSFHEIGQAIDISQSQMNDPKVVQALLNAGFTRPVKSEPRHWSYGEGADQFGGVSQSTSRFASDPNWNENGYFKSLEPDYKKYLADGKPALTDSKWKSLLSTYNLSEKEFREQAQAYAETGLMTSGGKQAASALESALKLYEYVNGNKDGFFGDSLQAGWADRLQANVPGTAQYDAKSEYNTLMARLQLNELFSAKENGASFGSMSDSEWDILGSAATNLDWGNSASVFKEKLEDIIGALELSVKDANVPMPSNYKDSSYVNGGNSKINSSGVVVKVPNYGNGTIAPMTYNPYETEWNNYPG